MAAKANAMPFLHRIAQIVTENVPMVMGHHVVSLDKELKHPSTFYKEFYC